MEVPPKSRFRWFRFSLRTLLVFVTLVCIYLGWALNWKRQRNEFLKSDKVVVMHDTPTSAPLWLRILGEEGKAIIYVLYFSEAQKEEGERLFPETHFISLDSSGFLLDPKQEMLEIP